jgi:type I restriction enzyme, S subunit
MKLQITRLDQCCQIISGSTPKTSVKEYWGGDIYWATPKDLSNLKSSYIDETPRTITKKGLSSCCAEVLPVNSVLFSSRAPIGHVAINRVPMATNQGFKSFIPDRERLDATFLYYWLSNNRDYLNTLGNGATFKELSKAIISRVEIPLPPIDQQKRIAAILDKAEELRSLRRQSIEQLDILGRSIFIEMFGDPAINRRGWRKGCLGDVASFIGGGTPKRDCSEYFQGSICWATSKDMKSEFLEDTQEHITSQAVKESSTNLVPIGTVLIVIKSKILMHSLPIAITKVPICFNQDIKGITISQDCGSIFVVTALRYGKKWLLDRARGANTEGLTLDHLKGFPLILPPLPLQQEFAQRIEAIEHLKSQHRESLAQLDKLFSSLQHRAFRGEL